MNKELRILHLEDNPVDAELIRETLAGEEISSETVRVETRDDFLAAIEKGCFNLILADYTFPSFDGLSALALARERCPDVPFIFVSGTLADEKAIESLKGGATDYVIKGKLSRLAPAVRRALKETEERIERKLTAGKLKESEARYRLLFENMLDGFAYCRMLFENDRPQDFIYLEVNRAFEELTGLKDVVGKKVTEVIPGIRESSPELFEVYGRVALTGRTERFEIYLEPLRAWLSISVYSTEKEHFIAVFDNITEQKLAEDRIKKIANEWAVTFDSMKDLISVHDKNFKVVRVNKAFAAALKMQPEEIIGKFCYELIHKTEEHWPVCPHKLVFEDKKPHTVELFEPGWGAYFEVSASPVLDDEGDITGTVHIIKDITERKKTEEEIKKKVEELEKFYELAVGRELKMKELKKEIEKLKEELSRYSKTKS